MKENRNEFITNLSISVSRFNEASIVEPYKFETLMEVLQHKELSYPAKVLYSYLFSLILHHNRTYISMPYRIVKFELGISKQQFYKDRNALESLGYIKVDEIKRDGLFVGRPNKERIELCFQMPNAE